MSPLSENAPYVVGVMFIFFFLQIVLRTRAVKQWVLQILRKNYLPCDKSVAGYQEDTDAIIEDIFQKVVFQLVNDFHNFPQIPLAVWAVFFQSELQDDKFHGVTGVSRAVCDIGAGFFLHDVVVVLGTVCIDSGHFRPEMLLHAVVCACVYTFSAISGTGHYFSCAFMLWECSSPFVHTRQTMYLLNLTKTKAYLLNGISMIVVFFVCRVVWGPIVLYQFFTTTGEEVDKGSFSPILAWFFRIAGCSLVLLNFFWFSKMIEGLIKLCGKRVDGKRAKVQSPASDVETNLL